MGCRKKKEKRVLQYRTLASHHLLGAISVWPVLDEPSQNDICTPSVHTRHQQPVLPEFARTLMHATLSAGGIYTPGRMHLSP